MRQIIRKPQEGCQKELGLIEKWIKHKKVGVHKQVKGVGHCKIREHRTQSIEHGVTSFYFIETPCQNRDGQPTAMQIGQDQ